MACSCFTHGAFMGYSWGISGILFGVIPGHSWGIYGIPFDPGANLTVMNFNRLFTGDQFSAILSGEHFFIDAIFCTVSCFTKIEGSGCLKVSKKLKSMYL